MKYSRRLLNHSLKLLDLWQWKQAVKIQLTELHAGKKNKNKKVYNIRLFPYGTWDKNSLD